MMADSYDSERQMGEVLWLIYMIVEAKGGGGMIADLHDG